MQQEISTLFKNSKEKITLLAAWVKYFYDW